MVKDDNAMCFTCKLGKTNCSFVKDMDGQVKIVRKKVKKPKEKQDMTMANVSEGGKEDLAVDNEMTEVSQSKGMESKTWTWRGVPRWTLRWPRPRSC